MYICTNCWYWSSTKLGKCPTCDAFGSFVAQQQDVGYAKKKGGKGTVLQEWWSGAWVGIGARSSTAVWQEGEESQWSPTSIAINNTELSRVFPQGITRWWVYLIAWEPGIGKSTLLLQMISAMSVHKKDVSYFTWEEHPKQLAERRSRVIGTPCELLLFHAAHLEDIIVTLETASADIVLIDSIQTISSVAIDGVAWSPSQVKYCSEQLSKYAKASGKTLIIVGHVTKEWEIAGPKYLEHIVDVVMYLEWDKYGQYRFLRIKKNRFGSTDEVAVFEMHNSGLQPAQNIHTYALSAVQQNMPWNVVTIGLDSGRPLLLYLEVLVQKMRSKYPQRVTSGVDATRLQLIIAILDKYLRTGVGFADVFVNIPGEFKGADAWLDLAVAAALWSQRTGTVLPAETIFLGELGLTGHVLPAKLHKKRVNELPAGRRIIDHTVMRHIRDLPWYV